MDARDTYRIKMATIEKKTPGITLLVLVAIFTPSLFIYRPVFGKILRIPFSGIRRATPVEWGSWEEYPRPTVHIELVVGGSLDVPLAVSGSDQVITRIADAVGCP